MKCSESDRDFAHFASSLRILCNDKKIRTQSMQRRRKVCEVIFLCGTINRNSTHQSWWVQNHIEVLLVSMRV